MADIPLDDNRYNTAISALTYGFNCLVLDPRSNKLHHCILSIHEQYINILHLIIAEKVSYLLKLHEIYNITDNQFSTQTKLKGLGITHYLILYTQSLNTFTFAFKTENEKLIFKIGMVLFIRQAKMYYDRLNEFDPFKAQAMMTFLQADKDGGNLLDIAQIQSILSQMKIQRSTVLITKDIEQINRILFDQEKIKKPSDMKDTELNELGFQYLLRYYSIKQDLSRIFKQYCNQYKIQNRSNKVSLIDIVRYNDNPIMSAAQLKEFYKKVLFQEISEEESMGIIQSFPVYDAEGKEKMEKEELINFNNFCSLLSSRRNSAFCEEKKQIYQKMNLPLTDYFISCDFSDYSLKRGGNETKINHVELSLKRGVRCLHFHLKQNKKQEPFISNSGQCAQDLEQVFKIISSKGFEFNPYPIIIKLQNDGMSKTAYDRAALIISDVFDDQLYTLPPNFQEYEALPSPDQLKKKVLIMAAVNPKLFKAKEKDFPQQSTNFFKIVSFFANKLDFQRKGQFSWNFVNIQDQKLRRLQEVEDENLSNYSKKILVKAGPTPEKGTEVNKSTSLYLRLGVQMIGLTFNNINEENYFVQSLFLENGGAKSGYLLKPNWMCLKNPKTLYAKNFDTPLFLLSVKVLSGQNCIMNEIGQQRVYLQIYLKGNKREEEINKNKVISAPQEASYYIQFNEECSFTIYCPDLAVLVLLIRGEKSNIILSGRAIPVRHLREGLHPVYLMGNHFKESSFNYLFVHSEHKEIPKKTTAYLQSHG